MGSLILSILTYGLQIIPLKLSLSDRLQCFYLKCIRYLINENFDYKNAQRKLKTNYDICKEHNIPTIHSILTKLRFKLYISWKNHVSFAYLNNEQYIDQELEELRKFIIEIKTSIKEKPTTQINNIL